MKKFVKSLLIHTLVIRCQTEDDGAFEELIKMFHVRIYRYAIRLMGSTADIDDVLQDVWIDVYRNIHRLRNTRSFASWLFKIVRNKIYMRFRQKKIHVYHVPVYELPDISEPVPDLSDENLSQLLECLDQLPVEQKDVLILKYYEDLSYKEMADCMNCPVGTVRSRLHYAKKMLKQKYEENNNECNTQ